MINTQAKGLNKNYSSFIKFSYISTLFFLITFIYNTLQPLKKTIIMTAGAGAEIFPYLKPFAVLPLSLVVTAFFIYLINQYDKDKVFKIMILSFLGYFALYTFILRPYRELLSLDTLANFLDSFLPKSFHAAPTMLRYWMDTLFYAASELWGSAILSTLLWGIVNEISSFDEAKRWYAYFTVAINCSGILAGQVLTYSMCFTHSGSQFKIDIWEQCFLKVMMIVFIASFVSLLIFHKFYHSGYAQRAEGKEDLCEKTKRKQNKVQLSLKDTFYSMMRSPNLLYIAILVLGYNIVYNLSDVVFNKQVHLVYSNDCNKLTAFLGEIDKYKSAIAALLALFFSRFSLNRFGWTFTAMITPIAYVLTGTLFYFAFIGESYGWIGYLSFLTIDPSIFVLYLGGAHFCVTKGTKYSLFDATKEMAYLTLGPNERTSGKAVVDGVASRFGKSGGSFIMFSLFALVGNDIALAVPYIFCIVMFISVLWIIAIVKLGQRYAVFQKAEKQEDNFANKNNNTDNLTGVVYQPL